MRMVRRAIRPCLAAGRSAELRRLYSAMHYELTDRLVVPADLAQTWAFFSQAENLPRITPSWLHFELVTPPPIHIEQDTLLDYTIRWAGLRVKWRTRIIDWSPPRQFIDLQLRGPYTLWHHQHRFRPVESGTECMDRVTYKLPLGLLGRAAHALAVRQQLIEIFRHRRAMIGAELGPPHPLQDVQIRPLGLQQTAIKA